MHKHVIIHSEFELASPSLFNRNAKIGKWTHKSQCEVKKALHIGSGGLTCTDTHSM